MRPTDDDRQNGLQAENARLRTRVAELEEQIAAARPGSPSGRLRAATPSGAHRELRSRLEAQIALAQKMESIGRLAGGIAHDLNNLLSPILGYTGMVLRQLPGDHPHREPLGQVLEAAERAQDLTSRLLAFGRRQTLSTQPLDLNELITTFLPVLRGLLREDLRLVLRLAPDLRPVRADPSSMQQVLINLFANARDAMPRGGVITVETTNEEPAPPDGADRPADREPAERDHAPTQRVGVPDVRLRVSDTGEGMDATTLERIFEPFFTTKPQGVGTGLGLPTVFGVVRQHGGLVAVDSTPGEGTTFRIFLPHVDEAPVPLRRPPPRRGAARGWETILVAEDDAQVRQLACRILRGAGYVVYDAADGEEALDLFDYIVGPVHLLVTDVIMPGLNGPDLYQQLARVDPALKVLYISGYPSDALAPHRILDDGIPLLPKPFTEESLTQQVRDVLDLSPG